MLVAPSSALAGQYQLTSDCTGGTPGELFVPSNTDVGSFTTTQTCPTTGGQESGLHVGMVKGAVSPFISDGAHAAYTFRTVAGTSITAIAYRRYFGQFGGDGDTVPALRDHSGAIIAGESCQTPLGSDQCSGGSSSTLVQPVTITGLNTSSLSFGLQCFAQAPTIVCGSSGPANEAAWFTIYSAIITVNEATAPSLGTTSGSLAGGGWLHGPHTLALSSATDPSGIASATLTVDAETPLGPSDGGPPGCSFARPKPCADLTGTSWSIDTATLPDGPHDAVVTARNAADVPAQLPPVSFATDNTPPAAPVSIASSAGPGWQGSSRTHLTWTLPPAGQGSPASAAYVAVCDRDGLTCAPATTSASLTGADVSVPGPGAYIVKVWLADAAGEGPAASVPFKYATGAPGAPTAISSSAGAWQSSPLIDVKWTPPTPGPGQLRLDHGEIEVCSPEGSDCGTPQSVGTSGGRVALPREGQFLLRAWVVDEAGLGDRDNAVATPAYYSSRPPTAVFSERPAARSTAPRWRARVTLRKGGPAPVVSAAWSVCKDARCPLSGQTIEGKIEGVVPGPGRWTLTATPVDAAGVAGRPTFTSFVVTRRLRPNIGISATLHRARLRIAIHATRGFAGRVALRVRYRLDGRVTVRSAAVAVRHGAGRAVLRLPTTVAAARVVARYPGSGQFLPSRADRRVTTSPR